MIIRSITTLQKSFSPAAIRLRKTLELSLNFNILIKITLVHWFNLQQVMSLKKLQEKIGATPDGSFGPNTLKKAMEYFMDMEEYEK